MPVLTSKELKSLNGAQKTTLCVLYHMLGMDELNPWPEPLPGREGSSMRNLCTAIAQYRQERIPTVDTTSTADIRASVRRECLMNVLKYAGNILLPRRGKKLALECDAIRGRGERAGRAGDGPEKGFSRDPFKRIEDSHIDAIALAVACYLVRGFALFWCREREQRDFNAAKTALNDFHQAYQLAWRLYQTLERDCEEEPGKKLTHFYSQVIATSGMMTWPGKSAYWIWQMLLLCEIMRANIYMQIHYYEEADRYYHRAQRRVSRLSENMGREHCDEANRGRGVLHSEGRAWFLTPTYVRSILERSKIQFDFGHFIESLENQINCVESIVLLRQKESLSRNVSEKRQEQLRIGTEYLLDATKGARAVLVNERSAAICDKENIARCFGCPTILLTSRNRSQSNGTAGDREAKVFDCSTLAEFGRFLKGDPLAPLTAEVMAHIGFTLITFRPRTIVRRPEETDRANREQADLTEWLRLYFRFDELCGAKSPSRLGLYCESLFTIDRPNIRRKNAKKVFKVLDDELERTYSVNLRMAMEKKRPGRKGLSEADFHRTLFATMTENIPDIVTIPRRNQRLLMRRGYAYRRLLGDLNGRTVSQGVKEAIKSQLTASADEKAKKRWRKEGGKFVVLRRWQSYAPKLPRPGSRKMLGGGYVLVWGGKGIVIDPGYDFIQNFYDQGFSLEDIHAVIVSHAHPDHDDDLATLLTLLKEWHEYHDLMGWETEHRKLDLFLNHSSYLKFSSWLQASRDRIGQVISLPVLAWDMSTTNWDKSVVRGGNPFIDLTKPDWASTSRTSRNSNVVLNTYSMKMEVVPAWHDDVINKTAAVGLKFHLYNEHGEEAGIVGYTGDTGAYGCSRTESRKRASRHSVDSFYGDCDVIVAHLGDIRLRELTTLIEPKSKGKSDSTDHMSPAVLFETWFEKVRTPQERHRRSYELLALMYSLDLIATEALDVRLRPSDKTVREILKDYLIHDTHSRKRIQLSNLNDLAQDVVDKFRSSVSTGSEKEKRLKARVVLRRILSAWGPILGTEFSKGSLAIPEIYGAMGVLAAGTMLPWRYNNHLGALGLYRIFEAMATHWKVNLDKNGKKNNRVFIVGELPEELASYRHMVARWLNMTSANKKSKGGTRLIKAFTGDIGLHIGLSTKDGEGPLEPKVRCTYCNYNNETVCKRAHYHAPEKILETPIKRLNSAMIYLCTEKDHHPERADHPRHFLSAPLLRII